MAGTFGSRAKNKFKLPSVDSTQTYYTLVNSETGEITVKRVNSLVLDFPGAENLDAAVGTIPSTGPNKGKFIPSAGITPTERQAFAQQPQTVTKIKEQAEITAKKGIEATGKSTQEAVADANRLLETGSQTVPSPSDPQGEQISLESLQQGTKASESKNRLGANTYGNTSYPIDRSPGQDYIKFTMVRYRPKSVSFGSIGGEGESAKPTGDIFGDRAKLENKDILGTVSLPIQPSISDNNTVNWGEDSMNSFQAAAAAASLNIIADGVAGAQRSAAAAGQIAQGSAGGIKSLIASQAAQAAAGGGENGRFFTRLTGAIINPNLELLFNGPQLRSFSFNFSLSARDETEAKAIRKIIRFFKQGMSVKRTETSLFLQSPNTFLISYIYGSSGKDHPWINKIKECALQNFSVNYTPAGNYATYLDGAMTQYDIQMQFGELDPIYDDDYDNDGDTTIGY